MRILILILLLYSHSLWGQKIAGIVLNKETKLPVEYVNIGVKGRNVGTVSGLDGQFSLNIDAQFDTDSLLFSCIGYIPFTVNIADLKKHNDGSILLKEKTYEIKEVVVKPIVYVSKTLGVSSKSKMAQAGFTDNLLGYECGLLMKVRKSAILKTVNINIASCSYDSIFYRLNIYQVSANMNFENILCKPIYIRLSKNQVIDKISIDLTSRNIVVDGDFVVSFENIKDLGPGYLYFCAGLSNKTYYRKTSQGAWETVPVGVSISVEADVEK